MNISLLCLARTSKMHSHGCWLHEKSVCKARGTLRDRQDARGRLGRSMRSVSLGSHTPPGSLCAPWLSTLVSECCRLDARMPDFIRVHVVGKHCGESMEIGFSDARDAAQRPGLSEWTTNVYAECFSRFKGTVAQQLRIIGGKVSNFTNECYRVICIDFGTITPCAIDSWHNSASDIVVR